MGNNDDETCCERVWSIISTNAACLTNSEDTYSYATSAPIELPGVVSGPKATLEMCKAWCKLDDRCLAIDYFSVNGMCALYNKACTKPLDTQAGASSYMYQDTRTTCDAYSCPSGYSLKAGALNITGQGRDLSTCCE